MMKLTTKQMIECVNMYNDRMFNNRMTSPEKLMWARGCLIRNEHMWYDPILLIKDLKEGGWMNELHQLLYKLDKVEFNEMNYWDDDYHWREPSSHNCVTWRHVN